MMKCELDHKNILIPQESTHKEREWQHAQNSIFDFEQTKSFETLLQTKTMRYKILVVC